MTLAGEVERIEERVLELENAIRDIESEYAWFMAGPRATEVKVAALGSVIKRAVEIAGVR